MDDHTVIGRAAAILQVLNEAPVGDTSLSSLCAETGIPKPTVRRIANSLLAHDLVTRHSGGYALGSQLVALGDRARAHLTASEVVAQALVDLRARFDAIAWAATLAGTTAVMLDTQYPRRYAGAMAVAWPLRQPLSLSTATGWGRLTAALYPNVFEELARVGLARPTRFSMAEPQRYRARMREDLDRGVVSEVEETRLHWWCVVARVPGPGSVYFVGLTGEMGAAPLSAVTAAVSRTAAEAATPLRT